MSAIVDAHLAQWYQLREVFEAVIKLAGLFFLRMNE